MTQSLPSIVICGRPNVGKSTLFNRLTESRRSIVTNEPGITRDRIYGQAAWQGRAFQVVDTGGIVPQEQAGIPGEILRQARVAIEGASVIVLVVDGRAGIAPLDAELAQLLRRTGRPLVIAVNKADTAQQLHLAAPFYELGKKVFPISAEHGLGVDDLLDEVTRGFAKAPLATEAEELAQAGEAREIRVAIIGRPNVGKSTLLNRLVGSERSIVSPEPGTTRDSVDTVIQHEGRAYRLVDTAGIRRKGKTKLIAEKLSVVMARRSIEQADVAVVVMDAAQGATSSDATIASYAQQAGRATIVVMNKWDRALELHALSAAREAASDSAPERPLHAEKTGRWRKAKAAKSPRAARIRGARQAAAFRPACPARTPGRDDAAAARRTAGADRLLRDYENLVRKKLKFLDYAPVLFLSALNGDRSEKLFPLIDRAYASYQRRISTGELNRWFDSVDLDRGTSPFGKKVRIYYITQAAVAPPTFILFTNQSKPLHFSYERFLENQLRDAFDFTGSPLRFHQRLKKR
jgi:GTP-binding protein